MHNRTASLWRGPPQRASRPVTTVRTVAIIHRATVRPTKAEVLERMFRQPTTVLGSYRFDDPEGEVGVEAFVVSSGAGTRHVVLTYRGEPLEAADAYLVSTMEHSVLGRRWIYDGTGDPVAAACFRRALLGQQDQAVEEIWEDGRSAGTREPSVRLSVVPGRAPGAGATPRIVTDLDLDLDHVPGAGPGPRLRAAWDGGEAIVATLAEDVER